MKRLFSSLIFVIQISICSAVFSFDNCKVTESCWYHPPECSPNSRTSCLSAVRWRMEEDGVFITLESVVTDLDKQRPYYASVGFSLNQKMNDDTVFECVQPQGTPGIVQLSFNDNTKNNVLPQASSVLLSTMSSSLVDGVLTCSGKILLDNIDQVANESRFMIHDLEARPYFLLFARGSADPYTLKKDIHSVNDNAQFPWISDTMVTFCRNNCSEEKHIQITEMKQSEVPRYWRYRIAVLHGVFLLLAWWVLGSSAILIARYFKPLFPRSKILGTAVWFQFHRDLFLISIILQILAVVFIFYQAGWVWYECSYECTNDDFAKKMHAITGFGATALAVLQPFFAFLRPSPNSLRRPVFNWLHWLVGMTAWTLASVTFVLSLPLGKTGLNSYYGHVPNWIMGGYIAFFLFCNVILEIIASSNEKRGEKSVVDVQPVDIVLGPSGMALSTINGPSTEAQLGQPTRQSLRLFVFFAHLVVSLGVVISITVMLVHILLSHSPN